MADPTTALGAMFASMALFSILYILGAIIALAIIILGIILWVAMIVDAAKRNFNSEGEKIAWVLVICLVGILGAIIYYFAVKHEQDKKEKSQNIKNKMLENAKRFRHTKNCPFLLK